MKESQLKIESTTCLKRYLFILLLTTCPLVSGQEKAKKYPAKILLNWQKIGIDAAAVALMKPLLKQSRQNMAAALLGEQKTLGEFIEEDSTSESLLNSLRSAKSILVSNNTTKSADEISIYQPIWCDLANYSVFFLANLTSRGEWISLPYGAVARKPIDALGERDPYPLFQEVPTELLIRASNQGKIEKKEALKLNFRARNTLTRMDLGSDQCLNLIASAQILGRARVMAFLGTEEALFVNRTLGLKAQTSRPNRYLGVHWVYQNRQKNPELPISLGLYLKTAEAIFGKRDEYQFSGKVKVEIENATLVLKLPESLYTWIERQNASLSQSVIPTVLDTYGAWAYLNVGRGYGLKINDRMVSTIPIEGKTIRGHIVKYYGPESGIQDKNGKTVLEGAILYIRKGQKQLNNGVQFTFDPTSYPVPIQN